MGLDFFDNGKRALYEPGNGHSIAYEREGETYYHQETPVIVRRILEDAQQTRQRLHLSYGDTTTGRDWLEEFETRGTIGRSMGPLVVPLLIQTRRSMGGGPLLDHCIVKITNGSGSVLYKHPLYHTGIFTIRPTTDDEIVSWHQAEPKRLLRELDYAFAVDVDGKPHANFKNLKAAYRFVKNLTT